MKVKIKVEREVNLCTLHLNAGVRYWEDSKINGIPDTDDGANIPCKIGEIWSPEIDIETGKILNWKQGIKADIHYKVCDECGWEFKDDKGEVVLSANDGYVPNTLSPKERGYGDYIIMDIDEEGQIDKWKFNFSDFSILEDI